MLLGVRDLECVIIHIHTGEAVLCLVDFLDLLIGQVEIFRKAVSGDCVCLIQAAGRNRVCQINPEKVIFPEYSVFLYLLPVCSLSAGVRFLVGCRPVIVDRGIVVQKLLEIQLFKCGHIALRGSFRRIKSSIGPR